MSKSFTIAAAGLVLLAACNVFRSDQFEFTGDAFQPDTNVTVEAITGTDSAPVSGWLALELHGRTGSGSHTLVLPAGLFLMPQSSGPQPVIALVGQQHEFTTAGGTFVVDCYCCDLDAPLPTTADDYDFGNVTDNTEMRRIIDIVGDKDLTTAHAQDLVQDAVWRVTEEGSLPDNYVDSLNALPGTTGAAAGPRERRPLDQLKRAARAGR